MTTPASEQSLLEELAGKGIGVELIDPLEAEKGNPLETAPPAALSPVKRLDATHSTKTGGKGFAVTLRGTYFAPSADQAGKKIKKEYRGLVINVPELEGALSIIKNKLLDKALKAKYPESLGHQTHEIESAIPLSAESPESNNIQFMSHERLVRFAKDHNVPIDVAHKSYEDVVVLRATLTDFVLNSVGFEAREKARQDERKLDADLAAMNPDIESGAGA